VLAINNDNARSYTFQNSNKYMVLSQVIQGTSEVNRHETMSDKGTVRTVSLILETD